MTLDPKNPMVKPGAAGSPQNILFIGGAETEFMETKDVPHGEVREIWYRSSTLGIQRRMHIYTPPKYDLTSSRYPVMYLLHGGGETDSAWSGIGRAGFIMDNLLAAEKARSMLIVMPEVPVPPARDRFGDELLQDIVPYVEKNYRTREERDYKALAGYSVGGYQTLEIITAHPEQFAYAAVWSAPVEARTVTEFGKEQSRFLANAAKVNILLKLLWFRMGSEDMGEPHVRALSSLLKQHGVNHDLRVSGGGHRWQNWRRYLHEYAQAIFVSP